MSSPGVTFNLKCGKGVTELQNLTNLCLSSFAESHQMQQKNFDVSPYLGKTSLQLCPNEHVHRVTGATIMYFFFTCMFYQLHGVQHSCSSTQSWGNVLQSIVETRDQNSRGCPLLFSNMILGSFCA